MKSYLSAPALVVGVLLILTLANNAIGQDKAAPAQRLVRTALRSTFSENFKNFSASDTGLLQGKPVWKTTFENGTRTLQNNHEAEWYGSVGTNGPFHLDGGTLEISATPQSGLPEGLTYISGLITTQKLFNQLYGYFEIRAQLPRGRGLWPAFWLLPSDGSWPPEIDIMEMLGDTTTDYYASIHAIVGQQTLNNVQKINAPDLAAGYHVFGVSWRPDHIRYYLDDVMVYETSTPPDMNKPMYILLNLAVGANGSWPGPPDKNTSGTYRISWVHVWQFNDLALTSR